MTVLSCKAACRSALDRALDYKPAPLLLNTWSLAGNWTVGPELVEANQQGNVLSVRFQARDANLGATVGAAARFQRSPAIRRGRCSFRWPPWRTLRFGSC